MSLRKAVKDVLDAFDNDELMFVTEDGWNAMQALRQALAEPYVPMTDGELMDIFDTADNSRDGRRAIQSAVLARAGIEVGK